MCTYIDFSDIMGIQWKRCTYLKLFYFIKIERRCTMPLSESQKKANTKYREKSIKRIPLDVQKEKYEEIKAAATTAGESVNGFIKDSINKKICTVKLELNKPANWNVDLQDKLEKDFLEPENIVSEVSRNADSSGRYSISLRFKEESAEKKRLEVIEKIKELLEEYDIKIINEA